MEKSRNGFIDKFSAIAGKIGSQRHLAAIRDGFVTMMPLLIVGSLVTLINNIPIAAEGDKTMLKQVLADIPALSWITTLNGNVWWGTFGMLSLFAVVAISYYLAKSYKADGLSAGVISLAAFMCAVPQMANVTLESGEAAGFWGFLNYNYLNAMGLFVAIIVALVATELFVRFSRTKKLIIKMPQGVPPAVSRSFAALLPGVLTILIVTLVTVLIELAASQNVFDIISETITRPFATASGTLGFGVIVVLLTHVLWIFGIHGPNILEGILQPLNTMAIAHNQELFEAGGAAIREFTIFNKSFVDAFVYMGGSGVGLGLVISIIIASKSKKDRMVGRLGLAPGLFNINEPVLFGLPIVLNPIFAVPFILAPLVSLFIAYGATAIGFLPVVRAIIPWTMPPILSGLFATGFAWQGPVIQIINLTLGILIYIPFVRIANKVEIKQEKEAGISK